MRVFAIGFLSFAAARVVSSDSPVTRVVELIKGLKSGIIADGEAEQKIYDKFACWCEDTTARKAAAIDAAKDEIAQLSKAIMQGKGTVATLEVDIKQVKIDIADNIKSTEEATALRNKEHEEFLVFVSNTEQARDGCEKAVEVLGKGSGTGATIDGGSGRKSKADADALAAKRAGQREDFEALKAENAAANAGFIATRQAETLSVVGAVRSALHRLPQDTLSAEDMDMMKKFVTNPMDTLSGGKPKAFLQASNNPFGDYAPASTQIQGILQNMYDTFVQNLADAKAEEKQKQESYDELMITKKEELASLNTTKTNKVENLGLEKKTLADNKTTRADTEAQLAADETFFADTKASCQAKADVWAERTRLRTEELGGIAQALKTLDSPEARATFESSATTLVQFNSQNIKKEAALRQIKSMATKSHSLRLAALAARVATSGHFDAVIAEIEKMITTLRQEEDDDVAHRDRCEKMDNALAADQDSLNHSLDKAEAKSQRLEAKSQNLQDEMDKTATEIQETKDAMAAALATRNEEHDQYIQAMKDDQGAVALLAKALSQMGAFYTNNAKFLQIAEPSYSEDPDKAPATFDKNYGGRKSETGGVLAILGMIKEDIQKEMGEAKKAEADAVKEFNELRSANTATERSLTDKHNALSTQKAETDQKNTNTESNIEAMSASKDATGEEKEALKADCDWIRTSFGARKEKRLVEIEGLQTAKSSLLGAGYEPEE